MAADNMVKTIDEIVSDFVGRGMEERDALMSAGELLYKDGRRIDALNTFGRLLIIDPENRKAKNYVDMINGILDYFTKDLLNP